ncbi:MAG TPA: ABC transporter permease [Vicinamibacterales bacterium]
MKFLPYVLKHLRRNKVRTLSTVLGMAICIFLVCVLQTMTDAMRKSLESAAPDRLVTRHNVSLVFDLPLAYKPRIERVPGVRRVAVANWFGGYYQDEKNFFANFAVEAEPYLEMYPEIILPPDQKEAFLKDLKGAIVGRVTAEKFGWEVGDTVPLQSVIPPYQLPNRLWEFTIRGIYDVDLDRYPGFDRTMMFFHFRHLYEALGQRVNAGTFYVQIDDPSRAAAIARTIDAEFENSAEQTKTETEQAFFASFAAMGGNLTRLLNFIGMAVAFTVLLVTANTMSMAVRERRTEIAVLKTLGFPGWLVMILILVEALLISVSAGLIGIGLAWLLVRAIPSLPGAGALSFFGITNLTVSAVVASLTFGIAVLLGLSAGFVPAFGSYRARITSMLRTT